jgi:hypothetical protein
LEGGLEVSQVGLEALDAGLTAAKQLVHATHRVVPAEERDDHDDTHRGTDRGGDPSPGTAFCCLLIGVFHGRLT